MTLGARELFRALIRAGNKSQETKVTSQREDAQRRERAGHRICFPLAGARQSRGQLTLGLDVRSLFALGALGYLEGNFLALF